MDQGLFTTFIGPVLFVMVGGGWAFRHRPAQRPRLLFIMVLMYLTASVMQYRQPSQDLFWLLLLFLGFIVTLMVWPGRPASLEGAEG